MNKQRYQTPSLFMDVSTDTNNKDYSHVSVFQLKKGQDPRNLPPPKIVQKMGHEQTFNLTEEISKPLTKEISKPLIDRDDFLKYPLASNFSKPEPKRDMLSSWKKPFPPMKSFPPMKHPVAKDKPKYEDSGEDSDDSIASVESVNVNDDYLPVIPQVSSETLNKEKPFVDKKKSSIGTKTFPSEIPKKPSSIESNIFQNELIDTKKSSNKTKHVKKESFNESRNIPKTKRRYIDNVEDFSNINNEKSHAFDIFLDESVNIKEQFTKGSIDGKGRFSHNSVDNKKTSSYEVDNKKTFTDESNVKVSNDESNVKVSNDGSNVKVFFVNKPQSSHKFINNQQSSDKFINNQQSSHKFINNQQSSHKFINNQQSSDIFIGESQPPHEFINHQQSSDIFINESVDDMGHFSNNKKQQFDSKQRRASTGSIDYDRFSTIHSESTIRDDTSLESAASCEPHDIDCENSDFIFDMMKLRVELARDHGKDCATRPCDRTFHKRYVGTFTKGLPHNSKGYVDTNEMNKLVTALKSRDSNKLSQVKLGSSARLVNPSASWAPDLFGAYNNTYAQNPLPSLESDLMAALMIELYCMSLTRDIPFSKYITTPIITECCQYMNALKSYPQVKGKVTYDNIFRGPMYGDLHGPYLSQFLYHDIKIGGFIQKQKYTTDMEGHDFMKTWDIALELQNGIVTEAPAQQRDIPRYLITGRDLTSYVHQDEPYACFSNASMIMFDIGVPMNLGIRKVLDSNPVEAMFVNMGRPDIQATINMVGRNALLIAWNHKWSSLFLRPEAYSIEVERIFRDKRNRYNLSGELLKNPILQAVRSKNGTTLLSQTYPEGCPLHPSTPAGHAVVAGASATVLKFFFETDFQLDVYEPDAEGNNLINTGMKTTVEDEINKLACNIPFGRNWAGIHYHMDAIRGLKLGEKVAISCLSDLIRRYPIKLSITLTKFSGKQVIICN